MKTNLIMIGNSRGIRLPSSVIKECGFGEQIELRVHDGTVELTPTRRTRDGWDDAFGKMSAARDDSALFPDTMGHDRDDEEWVW